MCWATMCLAVIVLAKVFMNSQQSPQQHVNKSLPSNVISVALEKHPKCDECTGGNYLA